MIWTSNSLQDTLRAAKKLGELLQAGDVVGLTGDLGAGKTTFVRGLAEGLKISKDYQVTSPTYVLMQIYPGETPIYHFDLYRISSESDARSLGAEDVLGRDGVTVVEWIERQPDFWTGPLLTVKFDFLDETRRKLTFSGRGERVKGILKAFEGLDL